MNTNKNYRGEIITTVYHIDIVTGRTIASESTVERQARIAVAVKADEIMSDLEREAADEAERLRLI